MKADFWRYYIMYEKGGFYADIDLEPFRPIKEWENFSKDNNSFIICPEIPWLQ